ncbi:hypothetical protein DPMN_005687 [Dreissena polymorpha]|uniref:Uncharacterized protein n=1 Tax=Dreissena polymorpha TaxID=45954 RepID=A0A9D4RWR6_DREPO|nr:hypothetical protein DPMN_005687 [Dreissena polymorpha]
MHLWITGPKWLWKDDVAAMCDRSTAHGQRSSCRLGRQAGIAGSQGAWKPGGVHATGDGLVPRPDYRGDVAVLWSATWHGQRSHWSAHRLPHRLPDAA